MEISYDITKEEYKNYFKKTRVAVNFFSIMMFIGIYFALTYKFFMDNQKILIFIMLLCVIILYGIIKFMDRIRLNSILKNDKKNKEILGKHICNVDDNGITEKIGNNVTNLKWSNIVRIKEKDSVIYVIPKKGKMCFAFSKVFLSNDEYDKIKLALNKYYNKFNKKTIGY